MQSKYKNINNNILIADIWWQDNTHTFIFILVLSRKNIYIAFYNNLHVSIWHINYHLANMNKLESSNRYGNFVETRFLNFELVLKAEIIFLPENFHCVALQFFETSFLQHYSHLFVKELNVLFFDLYVTTGKQYTWNCSFGNIFR